MHSVISIEDCKRSNGKNHKPRYMYDHNLILTPMSHTRKEDAVLMNLIPCCCCESLIPFLVSCTVYPAISILLGYYRAKTPTNVYVFVFLPSVTILYLT